LTAGRPTANLRARSYANAKFLDREPLTTLDERPEQSGPRAALPAAGRVLLALVVLALTLLSLLPLRPPPVVGSAASGSTFSAERARPDLAAVASEPRPMGSPAHARTRRHLVERLRQLGVEPDARSYTLVWREGAEARAAVVHNVAARLAGTAPTGSVLLAAHYDSVPGSPGAADNGVAVAALLETLRAMRQMPPPRNDVIFLFSDGEEQGLLGAEAFVAEHPWSRSVRVALNFEARGTRGATVMFETGPGIGPRHLDLFAEGAPGAVAASYSDEIYRRLPHDTDLSVFRRAGIPGFNFAFIGGSSAYHTALDSVEHVDPRSLQAHGAAALGVARRLAAADLPALGSGDAGIYFRLPGGLLARYPDALAVALALVLAAAVAALAWHWRRTRRLLVRRALIASLVWVGIYAVVWGAAYLFHEAFFFAFGVRLRMLGEGGPYLAAWTAFGAGAAWLAGAVTARRLGWAEAVFGAAITWSAVAVVAAALAPGASHLFLWPGVGALLIAVAAIEPTRPRFPAWPWAALGLVPILLVWAPTLVLLSTALGPGSAPAQALVAAAVSSLLLLPARMLAGARFAQLAAAAATLALIGAAAAAAAADFGPQRPRGDSLFYLSEPQVERALWLSFDDEPDAWTAPYLDGQARQTITDVFAEGSVDLLAGEAPLIELGSPRVTQVADQPTAEGRRLLLRVLPRPASASIRLTVRAPHALRLLSVAGEPVPAADDDSGGDDSVNLRFAAPPDAGFELELLVGGRSPVEVTLVDRVAGLPAPGGRRPAPRPADLMPLRDLPSDFTLVRATASF
jgi:hypothetical protein